jgi:hypothetical protein
MRIVASDLMPGMRFCEAEAFTNFRFTYVVSEPYEVVVDPASKTHLSQEGGEAYVWVIRAEGTRDMRDRFRLRIHPASGGRPERGNFSAFFAEEDAPRLRSMESLHEYREFAGI